MTIAAIPSPSTAVWHLGPFPVRAYALCIVLGIVVACAVTEARLRRRGAPKWAVLDVAVWAVPFGIVGARVYHVITSPEAYFGEGGTPLDALKIWEGGLGIWGAVAGGAVGAWLGCRQLGIPLSMFADALAPGLPLAQAVGRLGNWFNNELYGGLTTLPWGLEVHRMDPDNPGQAMLNPDGTPELRPGLYHPAFAYEALWNVGVALLVLVLDRRFRFGRGRAFALYVMGYTAGRFWIEMMRTDEANEFLGVRLNVWVSALVFLGALAYFLRVRGPRQFLVPADAGVPVAAGVAAAGDGSAAAGGSAAGEPTGDTTAGGLRVVGEDEFEEYRRTGRVAASGAAGAGAAGAGAAGAVTGGGDDTDDADDGADLVDASMPPLDDFADDETDDEDDAPADDEDDEDDTVAGTTDERSGGPPAARADDDTASGGAAGGAAGGDRLGATEQR